MTFGRVLELTSSLMLFLIIIFTAIVNVYYWFQYDNRVGIIVADKYGVDTQWLWDANLFRGLDENQAVQFLNGSDNGAALKKDLQSYNYSTYAGEGCIAKASVEAGSIYAMCMNIDDKFPEWAQKSEAIIFQDVYLSTLQEFRNGQVPSFLGAFQSFKNSRTSYYEHETIDYQACTRETLSRDVSDEAPRFLYTNEHGLLTSRDCNKLESKSDACALVQEGTIHELVPGGFISQYQVYVDDTNSEYVASTWSSHVLLGYQTSQTVNWLSDHCLYKRGDQIGWFGMGYSFYEIKIPETALLSKLQLMAVIGLIWYVDKQLSLLHLYQPIMKASRLGIFYMVVLQLVIAVQSEVDILRTIISWKRETPEEQLLFVYIIVSIGMVISLTSLVCVRAYGGPWRCRYGGMSSLLMPPIATGVACLIGGIEYSEYTLDNGMQYSDINDCPQGYGGCTSRTHINLIFISYLICLVPLAIDYSQYSKNKEAITSRRKSRVKDNDDGTDKEKAGMGLTTFERYCLHYEECSAVIPDMNNPYILMNFADDQSKSIKVTNPEVLHVANYSAIQGRFLCRTRDLYLVALVRFLPRRISKNQSIVVWPIKQDENETEVLMEKCVAKKKMVRVSPPVRIFLRDIHSIAHGETKHLLFGQDMSFA